jgi:Domain of unknown function (DUF4281)
MTPDSLFQLANTAVLPAWALLILWPTGAPTRLLVRSYAWSGALAALYLGLLIYGLPQWPADASFNSVAGIRALFRADWGLVTGWVHYLCFDLAVGVWITHDAEARGFTSGWRRWVRVPVLLLTFMFGPVGLLLWLGVRTVWKA